MIERNEYTTRRPDSWSDDAINPKAKRAAINVLVGLNALSREEASPIRSTTMHFLTDETKRRVVDITAMEIREEVHPSNQIIYLESDQRKHIIVLPAPLDSKKLSIEDLNKAVEIRVELDPELEKEDQKKGAMKRVRDFLSEHWKKTSR